uniref:AP2/ERF transcription factor n=1 Tax=Camptotheca acuminata TaxID=16922 RepID=A0A7G8AUF2_CAMAC|nr:AP2/ERF transcription factor [Camptotheca acuminata]
MVRPPARRNVVQDGRYKGVRMRKWGKWVAEVRQPNSRDRIWLGSYETAEEAAKAYDAALFCLRGPSAMLNFPEDPPNIPSARQLLPSEIQVAASRHARSGRALLETENAACQTVESSEMKPLVPGSNSAFFGESSSGFWGNCSFSELSTTDYYVATDERSAADDDDSIGAGAFWTF